MSVALATAQHSFSSAVPCSRLPRQFQNVSKDGDSIISLITQCHCSDSLSVKKCFLMFRGSLLRFFLCLLPLVLSPGTTEKSLALSSHLP